jgi:hypothetical protein
MSNCNRVPVRSALLALATAALLPTTAAAQSTPSGQWQYGASIYGYLPTVSGKTNFPTVPGGSAGSGIAVSSDQIIDALKFTFMGSFDMHNGRWGAFTDVIYLDLGGSKSQTRDFSFGNVAIPANTTANLNLDIKGWLWTVAGEYRLASDPGFTMDALAGARYFDLEQTLRYEFTGDIGPLPIPGRAGSNVVGERVWDGIIGVKGRFAFGENRKWSVPFYLDVGTGQSKRTLQAVTGIGYAFNWGEVKAMWRYLDYTFESGRRIEDVNFNGPMLGATFRW